MEGTTLKAKHFILFPSWAELPFLYSSWSVITVWKLPTPGTRIPHTVHSLQDEVGVHWESPRGKQSGDPPGPGALHTANSSPGEHRLVNFNQFLLTFSLGYH